MFAAAGDGLGLKTMWTDAPNAVRHLAALRAAEAVTMQEANELLHFIDHGWLVWPAAIEPALIDAFVKDIHSFHKRPGMFVTTNHRNNDRRLKISGDKPDRFESLFDLYVNFKSSIEVCFHPRLVRFLSLVFQAKPVAFQQLLFQRSNGHSVHQDTSVVAVEDPMLLLASWIALEDVTEGSGELAYYDRSHRLPHYVFKDGTKRISFANDDEAAYRRDLDQACRDAGMAYERFVAKKGDVFIWTADLVHRSHPKSLPDETSRLSCVTHYHPDTTTPFWFRFHPDKRTTLPVDDRGYIASSYYPLSKKKKNRMIAPEAPDLSPA